MKYIIDVPAEKVVSGFLQVDVVNPDSPFTTELYTGIICKPYIEPGRRVVEDEVWEFVRYMSQEMFGEQRHECFGITMTLEVVRDMSYQKAKAIFDKWKQEKDRIKVGDQVIYRGKKYFVVYVGDYNNYHLVDKNWIRVVVQHEKLEKTGRHSDLVVDLVKQLQEE